jgi:hypothetical protein
MKYVKPLHGSQSMTTWVKKHVQFLPQHWVGALPNIVLVGPNTGPQGQSNNLP